MAIEGELGQKTRAAIVRAGVEVVVAGGYDALQLREVARRARVSLTTIYKLFGTRDELVVCVVEHWMAANCYVDLAAPGRSETLASGLMRVFRYVFEPWERNPRVLEAYHRALIGPGGERLRQQGMSAIVPVAQAVMAGCTPAYARDLELILMNMAHALVSRFVSGELEVAEILPALERVVHRLTTNNQAQARPTRRKKR